MDQNIPSIALFIDYNQPSKSFEYTAAYKISSYYDVHLECVKVEHGKSFSKGEIKGRNAFFLSSALMLSQNNVGSITIGIHDGTNYRDCSHKFITTYQKVVDIYTNGQIKILTPFLKFYKTEIWQYAKKNKVPIELTYSCELGLKQPCGKCQSCQDLIELYDSEK